MKNKLLLLLLPLLFLLSCKRNDQSSANFEGGSSQEKVMEQEAIISPQVGARDKQTEINRSLSYKLSARKIIKTGEISFESDDIAETRNNIINAVRKYEAYLSTDNQSGYEGDKQEYTLVIKVPAANFDRLLTTVASGAGRIINKNIRVEDVSLQYIDQETRLKNMRKLEARYLELLAKATQISDMLKIENKLSELRTEIETATREFILLQQQVAYSTLTVTYYSKALNTERHITFLSLLKTSFDTGWDYLISIFFWAISIWPFLLALIILCTIIYRRRNLKISNKKTGSAL